MSGLSPLEIGAGPLAPVLGACLAGLSLAP